MTRKNERVVLLATREFKDFLGREARQAGVSVSELVRRRCTSPAGAPQPIAPLDIGDPISMELHHHEIRLARIEAELFGRNTPESDPVTP